MITWKIEIDSLDTVAYRDTKGPGAEKVQAMLEHLGGGAKGVRDEAVLRLLYERALRRGEVEGLDREHYDPSRGVFVMGKGRKQREWFTLAPETTAAINDWLEIRGDHAGPLFTALDHASFDHRLTGSAIYQIIRKLGARVGVVTRPHALRHSGITTSLRENNGNVIESMAFSRHASLDTLMIYNDAVEDKGGRAAARVAMPRRGVVRPAPASPQAPPRPSGPHWEAFRAWVEEKWEGADPLKTTAEALATFVRDQPDRKAALGALWSLRKWSEDEVATMKKILGVG